MKQLITLFFLCFSIIGFGQSSLLLGSWEGIVIDRNNKKFIQQWTFNPDKTVKIENYNAGNFREWGTFQYQYQNNEISLLNDGNTLKISVDKLTSKELSCEATGVAMRFMLTKLNKSAPRESFTPLLKEYKIITDDPAYQGFSMEIISYEEGKNHIYIYKNGKCFQRIFSYLTTLPSGRIFYNPPSPENKSITDLSIYFKNAFEANGWINNKTPFTLQQVIKNEPIVTTKQLTELVILRKDQETDVFFMEKQANVDQYNPEDKLDLYANGMGEIVVNTRKKKIKWYINKNGSRLYFIGIDKGTASFLLKVFSIEKLEFEEWQLTADSCY